VLPGVTVTLKGRTVAGAPSVVTNEEGTYRFPNLPPGTYDLTAELQGFATSHQTAIQVSLGRHHELNVQLKVSAQSETVTVTASSPVVDATSTQVATNYSHEWVANAPVRRFTFFDLINAAPGGQRVDGHELALAVVRIGHQREPLPDRRHRFHGAADRRGVAMAEYGRH
jgi:hypothetical protein